MNTGRSKVAGLLQQIIDEGEKMGDVDWLGPEATGWQHRAEGAIRIVSDLECDHFREPPITNHLIDRTGGEHNQELWRLLLPYRLATLRNVYERVALLDEADQRELDEVKHKWTVEANLGVVKAGYGQERQRRK